MGLIMLILIGTVPTTYALKRSVPTATARISPRLRPQRRRSSQSRRRGSTSSQSRPGRLTPLCRAAKISEGTYPSLAMLVTDIANQ